MTVQQPDGRQVIDQAIEWAERLRDGAEQSEAFFDWLRESPRHVEVLMQAMTLERRLTAVAPEDWARIEAAAGESSVVDLEPAKIVPLQVTQVPGTSSAAPLLPATQRTSKFKWWKGAIAAGVTVLAIAGWRMTPWLGGWQDFTTAVGEQRTIQLQDGSVVNLNTGTHLKVRMSASARDIRLLEGEALFKAQGDTARPFRVYARDAVIQAIGTQFNVYRRASGTTVSVLEGRVQVAVAENPEGDLRTTTNVNATAAGKAIPAALSAGEQVDIDHDGQLQRRAKLNAVRTTAWQQRRLIFDEEPLSAIVFEFNRYNRRQFHVEDAETAARRFSGIFDADDPDSLAQLLARDERLMVERGTRQIAIRKR